MEYVCTNIKIIINSVGLCLGMVGTFLIWRYGLPAEISRTGAIHLIAVQRDKEEIDLAKRYDLRSLIGFIFLFLSFLFQLIGNFL